MIIITERPTYINAQKEWCFVIFDETCWNLQECKKKLLNAQYFLHFTVFGTCCCVVV